MKTTGLSRVSKDSIISEIAKELKDRPTFFVTHHGSLSPTKLEKLRTKLRLSNSRYMVIKNSLGKKAFEKAKRPEFCDLMTGACGIAFTGTDAVGPSKILMDFSKENESFKVQNGFVDGQVIALEQIKVLANLPSREVLLGQVAGVLQAPIRNLAVVLNASIRSLAVVLNALSKKKEEK